jgi:hypothetical protein
MAILPGAENATSCRIRNGVALLRLAPYAVATLVTGEAVTDAMLAERKK